MINWSSLFRVTWSMNGHFSCGSICVRKKTDQAQVHSIWCNIDSLDWWSSSPSTRLTPDYSNSRLARPSNCVSFIDLISFKADLFVLYLYLPIYWSRIEILYVLFSWLGFPCSVKVSDASTLPWIPFHFSVLLLLVVSWNPFKAVYFLSINH